MEQRYFYNPFGVNGSKTEIPTGTDSTGLVSYNEGWTADYSLDLATDPDAKAVDAPSMTGILYDITYALQNLQQYGTPEFIDSSDNQGTPFAYDINARVRYSSDGVSPFVEFVSLVADNTETPGSAQWAIPVNDAMFVPPQIAVQNIADPGASTTYTLDMSIASVPTNGWIKVFQTVNVGAGTSVPSSAYISSEMVLNGANITSTSTESNTTTTNYGYAYFTKGQAVSVQLKMITPSTVMSNSIQQTGWLEFIPGQ